MKNSQLAILCCAVIGGSLIVAGTNVWLVRSLRPADIAPARSPPKSGKRPVIAVMPKAKGDPYFVSCRAGAEEAARELGVDLIWDGPTGLDAGQAERGGGGLDHARGGCDRGLGGELRRAFRPCCARRASAASRW